MPGGCGDHLRQRNQALKCLRSRQHEAFLPVRQLLHAVGNAYGQFSAADRAFTGVFFCVQRAQAEMAFPVAVIMVFAFFWEEFDGSHQPLSRLYRRLQPFIG